MHHASCLSNICHLVEDLPSHITPSTSAQAKLFASTPACTNTSLRMQARTHTHFCIPYGHQPSPCVIITLWLSLTGLIKNQVRGDTCNSRPFQVITHHRQPNKLWPIRPRWHLLTDYCSRIVTQGTLLRVSPQTSPTQGGGPSRTSTERLFLNFNAGKRIRDAKDALPRSKRHAQAGNALVLIAASCPPHPAVYDSSGSVSGATVESRATHPTGPPRSP